MGALIAVVDNETTFIEFVCALLEDEGYQTVCYVSECDAFDSIRESRPDLSILDLRMEHPNSGWHVLERVRLHPDTQHIPIILSSADAVLLREHEEHLRAKHCDILEKPFTLDDLLAKVEAAIGPPRLREAAA